MHRDPVPAGGSSIERPETTRTSPGDEGFRRQALLLRRVTEAANDTSVVTDALVRSLAAIREIMDWQVAHALVPDGNGGFRTTDLRDSADGDEGLSDGPEPDGPLAPRLVERATQTRSPAWSTQPDQLDPSARRAGLRGGVAVPVLTADDIGAILEFLTDHPVDLDDDLAAVFAEIGRQLGSVVERERHLAELEAVSEELRRSNVELERFAYIASHDLQEPLRKIVGFSQLLQQRYADELDDDADEYFEYIVDGARRLQILIRDLLRYSRAGRDELQEEAVPLADVLDDVVADLSMAIEESGARIDVGDLPTVGGDRSKLTVVLSNLVGNALKFRGDELPVVRVDARQHQGGWEVTVADNGIGIAPDQRERVFEVFTRLHTRTDFPGTGIGLALCRRIVERHGGRIDVDESELGGSAFTFTLPEAGPAGMERP